MRSKEIIISNIENNKSFRKEMKNNSYYDSETFFMDAMQWIKAIKQKRMLCIVKSISNSGMSRVFYYTSVEKNKYNNTFYYRQYSTFLRCMGYSEDKNTRGIRIGGCGMDMNFNTNYNIIHDLKRLGFISKAQCREFAQMTPACL